MRTLLTLLCLFSFLYPDTLFFHIPTQKWLGVTVKNCENKLKNLNSVKNWEDGNYFLDKDGACKEVVSYLHGEQITYLEENKYSLCTYEKGLISGWKKTYFANKKICEEEFYIDGVLNGEKKIFDEKGYLKLIETYKNGVLNGQKIEYSRDGRPSKLTNYENGKKSGFERIYNVQGRPSHEFLYENGEILLNYKRYYYNEQGDFSHVASYEKDGDWIYYTKNGDILKEVIYENNHEMYVKSFDIITSNNESMSASRYKIPRSEHSLIASRKAKIEAKNLNKMPKKEDETDTKNIIEENEKILKLLNFLNNDISIGDIKIYYDHTSNKWFGIDLKNKSNQQIKIFSNENKLLIELSVDKDNTINGWLKSYYQSGNIMATVYYENGKKEGVAKKFNENGLLEAKWFYVNDYISGALSIYYMDSSNLKTLIPYKNNIPNGTVIIYNQSGKVHKKVLLKNGQIIK